MIAEHSVGDPKMTCFDHTPIKDGQSEEVVPPNVCINRAPVSYGQSEGDVNFDHTPVGDGQSEEVLPPDVEEEEANRAEEESYWWRAGERKEMWRVRAARPPNGVEPPGVTQPDIEGEDAFAHGASAEQNVDAEEAEIIEQIEELLDAWLDEHGGDMALITIIERYEDNGGDVEDLYYYMSSPFFHNKYHVIETHDSMGSILVRKDDG